MMSFLLLLFHLNGIIVTRGEEDVLNVCLDGFRHKTIPGPEAELFQKCAPWKDRSCCTNKTSYQSHQDGWNNQYNFTYDHCSEKKTMSQACREMFYHDNCFYECSPNYGPWIVAEKKSYRNERFRNVPLCESQCVKWWEACKDDYTCKSNWSKGWNWESGINKCPNNSKCRTFRETFANSTNFCQSVYPDDFTVILNDSAPCMTFWFEGKNPNDEVARYYAKEPKICCGCAVHRVSVFLVVFITLLSRLWNY